MREIKFRAWDEGNKIMHYDFQFIKSGDSGNDWIIFISDKFPLTEHKTNPFTNPNPYFAQQLKIMQFTGLHDKNGKEIYEGDILRTITYENIYEVSFHIGSFVLVDRDPGFTTIMKQPIGCYQTDILLEVIGNIYENPELSTQGASNAK